MKIFLEVLVITLCIIAYFVYKNNIKKEKQKVHFINVKDYTKNDIHYIVHQNNKVIGYFKFNKCYGYIIEKDAGIKETKLIDKEMKRLNLELINPIITNLSKTFSQFGLNVKNIIKANGVYDKNRIIKSTKEYLNKDKN